MLMVLGNVLKLVLTGGIQMNEYYIMGYGRLGKYLEKFFTERKIGKFLGFLDNKARGENILKPDNVSNKDVTIIVGSINYMYEMLLQLKKSGFVNIKTFAELTLKYPELQSFNQAFLGLKEDYENNKEKYVQLRNLLTDEKSKKVLDTIIEFRKTFDITLYSEIADNVENQYFEDFMLSNIDVFIDGGAFDGDTVQRLYKHDYKPQKIYFFEPDQISLNKAKETLKNYDNIEYFPNALSDTRKTLKFDTRGDLGSCFSNDGDVEVKCVSIDEVVKEDKAFIKLDIEGAELDALNGAKRLLRNGSSFAICLYHKPSDIWRIPELLLNIINNKVSEVAFAADGRGSGSCDTTQVKDLSLYRMAGYNFYLRHYTNTIFETVLYGEPLND